MPSIRCTRRLFLILCYFLIFITLYHGFPRTDWVFHSKALKTRMKVRVGMKSKIEMSRMGKVPTTEKPMSQKWYREKQGHLSPNQKRIIRELWPLHGIDLKYGTAFHPKHLFRSEWEPSNNRSVYLDIGFGSGDSLIYHASNHPKDISIGVEIHRAGISSALKNIEIYHLTNVKIIRADISLLLNQYLQDRSIDIISVYFPDPWPNEFRDGERRVIRSSIIRLLSQKIIPGGKLRIATDVEDYAHHIERVMISSSLSSSSPSSPSSSSSNNQSYELSNDRKWLDSSTSSTCCCNPFMWYQTFYSKHLPGIDVPSWRTVTKYELKAGLEGRQIYDFEYQYIHRSSLIPH